MEESGSKISKPSFLDLLSFDTRNQELNSQALVREHLSALKLFKSVVLEDCIIQVVLIKSSIKILVT